jgi:hypothetical protein
VPARAASSCHERYAGRAIITGLRWRDREGLRTERDRGHQYGGNSSQSDFLNHRNIDPLCFVVPRFLLDTAQ